LKHKFDEEEQRDIRCNGETNVGVGGAAILYHVIIDTANVGEEVLIRE
jgi:hypothetical protein